MAVEDKLAGIKILSPPHRNTCPTVGQAVRGKRDPPEIGMMNELGADSYQVEESSGHWLHSRHNAYTPTHTDTHLLHSLSSMNAPPRDTALELPRTHPGECSKSPPADASSLSNTGRGRRESGFGGTPASGSSNLIFLSVTRAQR